MNSLPLNTSTFNEIPLSLGWKDLTLLVQIGIGYQKKMLISCCGYSLLIIDEENHRVSEMFCPTTNHNDTYEGMSPCPLISKPQNLPFLIQTIYTKLAFNLLASTHLHSYLAHGSLHFFSSSLIFFLFFQFLHQLLNVEGHVTLFQELAVSFRIDLSIHQHVCIC